MWNAGRTFISEIIDNDLYCPHIDDIVAMVHKVQQLQQRKTQSCF